VTPRVSVLLPVRDAAGTLPACLASLAAQTLEDHELVAVDDGSREGSAPSWRWTRASSASGSTALRSCRSSGPPASPTRCTSPPWASRAPASACARPRALGLADGRDLVAVA
jgi:hypothetical protein